MIRVMVVDDSALMRRMLQDLLPRAGEIEVACAAASGRIALDRLLEVKPDVVTLDVDMPGMDGIEVVEEIMASEHPCPIVMFSSLTARGAEVTLQALEAGAADYVLKPAGRMGSLGMNWTMEEIVAELALKVLAVARFKPRRRSRSLSRLAVAATSVKAAARPGTAPAGTAPAGAAPAGAAPAGAAPAGAFVAVGISTGGPPALMTLLSSLGAGMPPMAIVQHMPDSFIASFTARLNGVSSLEVVVAKDDMTIAPGVCVVAPGDRHLEIVRRGDAFRARLHDGAKVSGHRPSADVLFISIAAAAGEKALGVLMTGMGRDGADGMGVIRRGGGRTIAQDQKSCVVYGMPRAAVDEGNAERVLPLDEIAGGIMTTLKKW